MNTIGVVASHPSGDPTPSRNDIKTTKRATDAAMPLGIAAYGHSIIGRDSPPASWA
jgi:DNA repair protein RadC